MITVRKIGSIGTAVLLSITMFVLSMAAYVMNPEEKEIVLATEEVVYSSTEELYSAMRAVFKNHQSQLFKFYVTDELLKEVCTYDEIFNSYRFDLLTIYDFYGDQTSLAANEGDYLDQNHYGFLSRSTNDYIGYIEIDTSGTEYATTIEQEETFEKKLKSLFVSGGALADVKNLSDYEKVVACMDYIRANVKAVSTTDALRHTAYSALCEGKATCQGYALLFYRMLREVGIANRILMGVDSAAHTYNIVMLDGKYYYCDASANVLLKGSNNFKPAQLQEQYLTDSFSNNVLAKISDTDYVPETPVHSHDFSKGDCGEIKGKEAHVAGEWVIEKEATVEAAGSKSKSCTKCGYVMETKVIDKLPLKEYQVVEGANSIYQANEEGLALRADGEFEKFVNVEVDGKIVEEKYYTVKSGSTIITFTKEFMDKLSEGEHVVKFNFTDGFANANITISSESNPSDEPTTEPTTEITTEVTTEVATEVTTEVATEPTTEVTTEATSEVITETTESLGEERDNNGGTQILFWVVAVAVVGCGVAGLAVLLKRYKKSCNNP